MGNWNVSLNDLDEVVMDLEGVEALFTLLESSEYYQNGEDRYVCRAIRNSITETKRKLKDAMGDYYEDNTSVLQKENSNEV